MTFWTFLNRLGPGWPSERQWVTFSLFALTGGMLLMARENPELWNVKLFEFVLQAIAITGVLNMVVAFHFAANKGDEQKAANTAKAFDAISAAAKAATPVDPQGDDKSH